MDSNGAITRETWAKVKENYPRYADAIERLQSARDLPWTFLVMLTGGGSVFRARNRFASDFMAETKNPDDRLFFIDVDLLWEPQDVVDVLLHDQPIMGGLYTIRAKRGHWVMNKMNGAAPWPNGVLQVMEHGTGFKCFKRSVFQKVLDDCPGKVPGKSWLDCRSDFDHKKRELCFFSAGPVWDDKYWPGEGRCLTEDYWFDWLCRESGIPTYVDTKIKLRHKDDVTGEIFPEVFPEDPCALPAESPEP